MKQLFKIDDSFFMAIQNFADKYHWLNQIWIFLAQYLIYFVPFILVILWFWSPNAKKAAFKSFLTSLVAWLGFAKILAILVHRPRPSEALIGAKELLFHRADTSFPSDHATMLFALALSIRLYGFKTLGNVLLVAAAVISICRVFVGVHFPLDVIFGAILGILVAFLMYVIREYIDTYLTNPILGFLKRFHL